MPIKHPTDHIFAIGDSHANFNFKDVPEVTIKSIGSITMHRVGRDKMTFKDYTLPNSIAIFIFGEIDIRMHIYKQVQLGRDEDEIINTLVVNYIEVMRKQNEHQVIPIVMSITPPSRTEPNPMAVGSNEDRSRYCLKINDRLRNLCLEYDIDFLDVYEQYKDRDGMLMRQFADPTDGYHISQNNIVNDYFHRLMEAKGY